MEVNGSGQAQPFDRGPQLGLVTIAGPTATGKSGLALALAARMPIVILSADSRQVYREFDIGTAKPAMVDQQQVPHYLIDICSPVETLTVADYQQQAQKLIDHFLRSPDDPNYGFPVPRPTISDLNPPMPAVPMLVGGTGLYIRAVTRGLKIPRVPPQPSLRNQLTALGQRHCYALLQQVDETAADRIHPNDPVRTLRALEVFYVTGQPISQLQGEQPPAYPILHLGLDCSNMDALQRRIAQRTRQMIDLGFVAEVERLRNTYGPELPLLNTLGYQEMSRYLAGDSTLAAAEAAIVQHTRQFAKRQRTWFRADPQIHWFDADAPDLVDQVWEQIQVWSNCAGVKG